MKAVFDALLSTLAPIALTAISGGTLWVSVKLGTFLHAKAVSSKAFAALAVLSDQVMGIVQDIENVEKAAILAKGGPLTSADGAQLKQLAMDRIKKDLGEQGLATLQKMVSALLGSPSVDTFLSGFIEKKVAEVSSPLVAKAATSP